MESLPNFEEVNIQKYLEVIQRRWLPLVGIFSIAVPLGCLYAFSLKPSYKSEGSLMIKTNRSSSLTGTDILQLSYKGSDPDLAAKIVNEVIDS